jgi:hypothetical protein
MGQLRQQEFCRAPAKALAWAFPRKQRRAGRGRTTVLSAVTAKMNRKGRPGGRKANGANARGRFGESNRFSSAPGEADELRLRARGSDTTETRNALRFSYCEPRIPLTKESAKNVVSG